MLVQDTAEKTDETAMPGRESRVVPVADGQQNGNGQTGWQREGEDRQMSSDIARIKTKLTEIDEVKSQVENLQSLEKEIRQAESDIERLGMMSSFEGQGESDQEILGGGARAADSAQSWPGEDRPPFFIAPYTLTRSSGAETEVVLCAINPTWTHDGVPMTLVYGKQGGIEEGQYDTSGLLAEVTVVPLCTEAEAKGKTLVARASQVSKEFSLFLVDSFPLPGGSGLEWEDEGHTDVIIAKFTDIIETIQIGGIVTSTGGTVGVRTVASFSVRSRTVQNEETEETMTVWEVFSPTWVTEAAEYKLSEGWYSLETPFDGAKLYAILEMTIANDADRTVTVNGLIVTLHEEEYQNTDPVDPGQSTEGSVGKRYYKVMIGSFSSSPEGGPVSFTQYHIGCIVERPIINEQSDGPKAPEPWTVEENGEDENGAKKWKVYSPLWVDDGKSYTFPESLALGDGWYSLNTPSSGYDSLFAILSSGSLSAATTEGGEGSKNVKIGSFHWDEGKASWVQAHTGTIFTSSGLPVGTVIPGGVYNDSDAKAIRQHRLCWDGEKWLEDVDTAGQAIGPTTVLSYALREISDTTLTLSSDKLMAAKKSVTNILALDPSDTPTTYTTVFATAPLPVDQSTSYIEG